MHHVCFGRGKQRSDVCSLTVAGEGLRGCEGHAGLLPVPRRVREKQELRCSSLRNFYARLVVAAFLDFVLLPLGLGWGDPQQVGLFNIPVFLAGLPRC